MLEVLPIQDKAEQEALCLRCNVPFRVELLAYKALVDGELRGICQFTMNQEGGKIVDFAHVPNLYEFEPMFVMGRAALNFIDLCGIHRAFFDAEYDNETLANEYFRDKNKGLDIDVPKNYFPGDDPSFAPINKWRGHAHLLFSNWLNYYVYQMTPFDVNLI